MSLAPISVRSASVADVEQCATLARLGTPERVEPSWMAALTLDLQEPTRLLVVATTSTDELIGYARARLFAEAPDPPDVPAGYHLTGIFVRPDLRGRGVGAQLVRSRLDWIAEYSDLAWSFADASNVAAIALHMHCGFEAVIRRRFAVPGMTVTDDAILFRARLR